MRRTVVVIALRRSQIGSVGGSLSDVHPADLAGGVLAELASGLPATPDEVIVGCATQVGAQSHNLARSAVGAAGLPEAVSATALDQQGASGLAAVRVAAGLVAAGLADLVVAGGVESHTQVGPGAAIAKGVGRPFGPAMTARYADAPLPHGGQLDGHRGLVGAGPVSESIARAVAPGPEPLDEWAHRSRTRAAAAGWFAGDAAPVADELVLPPPTPALPLYVDDGRLTAAHVAPAADAAAFLAVTSLEWATERGVTPLAVVTAAATGGGSPLDPVQTGLDTANACWSAAGWSAGRLDWVALHEPSTPIAVGWANSSGVVPAAVNPCGGTLAWGDPTGATGALLAIEAVVALGRPLPQPAPGSVTRSAAVAFGWGTATVVAFSAPQVVG